MRADLALVDKGLCPSRAQAQTLIEQGKVLLRNGVNTLPVVVKKASQRIEPFMTLELIPCDGPNFVSRGGLKLHHALEHTRIEVENKRCIDLGQSTGGFTDCLLQHAARSVVGVDVGKDQLHPNLKENKQVLALEGINLYKVNAGELQAEIQSREPYFLPFELAVADLSFISLRKVLPNVTELLPDTCEVLFLVKPQFELGPEHIGKNGLVKNLESLIGTLEDDIRNTCANLNLQVIDFFPCALKGGDGNQEYFVHAVKKDTAAKQ
ncbi:MAG: TlyA family RNA methyltransferase [Limnobacter sp.]|uniref:TlyA family RNA methyltransferase n=1 Tax=Limnobacter sp. TaxID=2003368 RepID=UPI0022CD1E8E|nr:TlyA family RNA methyltransferase [Limnobacter sp.]MCZ8016858.1 TlyA family RNA methyltransferase [Limnobacter sp.]